VRRTVSADVAADIFIKLYNVFKEKDSTMIEINPLAEVEGGDVLCMDACKKGGRGVGVSFLSSVWTMRELGNDKRSLPFA
jgi:hypothetical protein